MMIERRARQRFPLRLRAEWREGNAPGSLVQAGETLNLSSSGLYLLARECSLAAGQRVEVSVWLPVASRAEATCLSGSGRVVRIDKRPRAGLGVVIALDRMNWLREEEGGAAT